MYREDESRNSAKKIEGIFSTSTIDSVYLHLQGARDKLAITLYLLISRVSYQF